MGVFFTLEPRDDAVGYCDAFLKSDIRNNCCRLWVTEGPSATDVDISLYEVVEAMICPFKAAQARSSSMYYQPIRLFYNFKDNMFDDPDPRCAVPIETKYALSIEKRKGTKGRVWWWRDLLSKSTDPLLRKKQDTRTTATSDIAEAVCHSLPIGRKRIELVKSGKRIIAARYTKLVE
ncbi:MAG: hypothetical protein WCF85_22235 [Rhodospirillaceae bacterium]